MGVINYKKLYYFDWKIIVEIAHKKAGFASEDLIVRLKTFPISLLKKIKLIDKFFLDTFDDEYKILIDEIKNYLEHKKD